MGLPVINAVWIGKTLGPTHAACLASFVRTDHTVVLHTYGDVDGVPRGVTLADANRLWPGDRLLRYAEGGGYSLSANLIRYQMLRRGLGLYVDCDVYCVRPIEDADYILGWEDAWNINCAVLKLPPDSPVTVDLAAIEDGWVPPWWADRPHVPLAQYPWGTTGPRALTHAVKTHGFEHVVAQRDVFYPVHYGDWQRLTEPGRTIADLATPDTHYIHLWNELSKGAEIVPGSPLHEMLRAAEDN